MGTIRIVTVGKLALELDKFSFSLADVDLIVSSSSGVVVDGGEGGGVGGGSVGH